MALVDVDSWFTEYEACERLNHDLLAQLQKRENLQRQSDYNRITTTIQIGLGQFGTELRQLKLKVDAASESRSITFEESERRQRQVEQLQSQLQQLQTRFSNANRTDRSALLDTDGTTQSQPARINSTDINLLKQQKIQIIEDQNRGLEALSQTISRQRALASQFGQEVEEQNDILDNLTNNIERVDMRVNAETQNIGQLNRQDSTFGYWIIIIILFLAIIIVLAL